MLFMLPIFKNNYFPVLRKLGKLVAARRTCVKDLFIYLTLIQICI